MHSRGLQGHGCSHFNSDSGMDSFRHDKSARCQSLRQQHCQRFRTGTSGLPSHDCLPDCCVLSICNRYKLGYLRYSYPHRAGRIPFRTDDGHFHCLLPCRCRLRRPLFSHFRHAIMGICNLAGVLSIAWIALPVCIVLMGATLLFIRKKEGMEKE